MTTKDHNNKFSLIQRIFSIFLYGIGVHKEGWGTNLYTSLKIILYEFTYLGLQTIAANNVVHFSQVNLECS